MKDKYLILYGNPGSSALSDPEIQSFEDATRHLVVECPYAADPSKCSPPCFGCIRVAGARMARGVIEFYPEASERTLALERDFFRREGALPPKTVIAYIDPDRSIRRITDPEQVVQRVWEYARSVLDLKPGEHVARSAGWRVPPASDVPPALLRHGEQCARGGKPGKVGRGEVERPRRLVAVGRAR
jgi:hypothetical protein